MTQAEAQSLHALEAAIAFIDEARIAKQINADDAFSVLRECRDARIQLLKEI